MLLNWKLIRQSQKNPLKNISAKKLNLLSDADKHLLHLYFEDVADRFEKIKVILNKTDPNNKS